MPSDVVAHGSGGSRGVGRWGGGRVGVALGGGDLLEKRGKYEGKQFSLGTPL